MGAATKVNPRSAARLAANLGVQLADAQRTADQLIAAAFDESDADAEALLVAPLAMASYLQEDLGNAVYVICEKLDRAHFTDDRRIARAIAGVHAEEGVAA